VVQNGTKFTAPYTVILQLYVTDSWGFEQNVLKKCLVDKR